MGIAMLRTLGATPGDIVWIFLLHGALIGILGASLGLLAGYGLALAAPGLAGMLEWVLGLQLLNTDIYPLSFLPVDIRARDGVVLWIVSVSLCLLAALIPAQRAAKLPVAQIMAAASR
jgi:lipoprotein-releasing system permease protein